MCKSVPQIAVEVIRIKTSVGASIRSSSTVSMSSVLSPRQTTAFMSFPFFLQTLWPNNFAGFLQALVGIADHMGRHHDRIKLLGTNVATRKRRFTQGGVG